MCLWASLVPWCMYSHPLRSILQSIMVHVLYFACKSCALGACILFVCPYDDKRTATPKGNSCAVGMLSAVPWCMYSHPLRAILQSIVVHVLYFACKSYSLGPEIMNKPRIERGLKCYPGLWVRGDHTCVPFAPMMMREQQHLKALPISHECSLGALVYAFSSPEEPCM